MYLTQCIGFVFFKTSFLKIDMRKQYITDFYRVHVVLSITTHICCYAINIHMLISPLLTIAVTLSIVLFFFIEFFISRFI